MASSDHYARVAVTIEDPGDLVRAISVIQDSDIGEIVGVKNGYRKDAFVPVSEYRHFCILVRYPLPRDYNTKYGKLPKGSTMIIELQILLNRYLENKLTTSIAYKIRRAKDWDALTGDFKKYLSR